MSTPLEGIKILDMTHFQSGPSATQLLAWLGAEVIKIEEPLIGDKARIEMSTDSDEDSFYFRIFNSNKKSICLDIKSSLGLNIFKKLIKISDVIVENFAPGYMDKLGLDYKNLKKINPKIIYASIKGYGSKGINSKYKSFEGVAQAASGIMSTNGEPNNEPQIVSAGVSASGSGLNCVIGILTAIINRSKTQKGDFIDISMQDASLNLNRMKMINTLSSGTPEPRIGNILRGQPSLFACYPGGYYDYIYICIGGESWESILAIIDRSDLILDEKFSSESSRKKHFNEIKKIIEKWTMKYSKFQIMDIFNNAGIPCSAVYSTHEITNDVHLISREMIVDINSSNTKTNYKQIGSPINMDSFNIKIKKHPLLGEHSEELLKELLGFDEKYISELRNLNIIN